MKRLIEDNLLLWKNNDKKKPLIVLGVRQCGKTFIIDDFCKKNYKKYTKVDLVEDESIIEICEKYNTFEKRLEMISIKYNFDFEDKDSILFIDEIQKCELLIQDLKAFNKRGYTNIIVAGSLLSVEIKKMKYSFPVGNVNFEYLYPMNFEEFLIATGNERYINIIRESFINNKPTGFHNDLMELFKRYLYLGGMPEMVKNYIDNNQNLNNIDDNILSLIFKSYSVDITKHIDSERDKIRAMNIYNNIAPQLLKENPKFMYAKFEKKDRKSDYITALDWLVTANMVLKCNQLTKPEFPIKGFVNVEDYKLFLSDVGLLRNNLHINAIDIMMDGDYSYKGVMIENYIANELMMQFGELFYWTRKNDSNGNKAEVDFIIQVNDRVIPIEVKSGNNRVQSLNIFNELNKPSLMVKIGNCDFGMKDNLKTIPLYAAFLLKEL